MQKHITAAELTPIRFVIVTLDGHLASAVARVERRLSAVEFPGLTLSIHVAADWQHDPRALQRCLDDIAHGDIVFANMLFMDDHIRAVLPALQARRETCDAMVGCIAASEIVKLTRLGRFEMGREQGGALSLLKKLRGNKSKDNDNASSATAQMRMLRRIPKILKYIPGPAQDVRAYFLSMQYWLSGSDENIENLVRYLVSRYASGARAGLRGQMAPRDPVHYPEVGLYHPRISGKMSESADALPRPSQATSGRVGLLLMRSYLLAGNTAHYDAVIAECERQGLEVVPAFASGLDARPAIERYFMRDGRASVDAVLSLTGFSLVGGPAYNDARAAEKMLATLDVPYVAALPVEFQSLDQWRASAQGLLPIEATVMVAIPELDGATGSMVFGGRASSDRDAADRDMQPEAERIRLLVGRIAALASLRRSKRFDRKVAIVLFNFPPNAGATGTAAFLSVFESLHNTLRGMKNAGYDVDVPETVDALRASIIDGNALQFGANANVHARIGVDDHVRNERWLKDIEAQWGSAPGRHNTDGSSIFILGARFGKVFVGIQPAFGYEGDPMRLLFEQGFAPTHAFSAFYRWLKKDFGADAVLHFGTHGALEFMPGKQVGLSSDCWPDRLIGALPSFYLYAANNPAEGMLAKRRASATLVSYLTPPLTSAGLYRGLLELKSTLNEWRQLAPAEKASRSELLALVQAQAVAVDLTTAEPAWTTDDDGIVDELVESVIELEQTLIPHGLHVVGEAMSRIERVDLLAAVAESGSEPALNRKAIENIVDHKADLGEPSIKRLAEIDALLAKDHEVDGLIAALDARYIRPVAGGDLLRDPEILPTGRNIHGFDPFRIPSAFALTDGRQQAERLLSRYAADGHGLPETVALVLWGTDNLKSGGGPIAQALALIGAQPRFDSYGRLAGAELVPLETLGRPRIDIIVTLSGIFRDLLPLQIKLLAEAAWLAASADEPLERNFVRKHALQHASETGIDFESASLRVFGNADGAYGSNINHMIENGRWSAADELAEIYSRRKGFAYSRHGQPSANPELLAKVLAGVDLTYQNLESVELGVTTIDTYFDTLGGITGAVRREKGTSPPVYIGDQTRGAGRVRSLDEQIALETRTRVLNPKWFEGMLKHGYEGVRQIEAHVTNTMGWSATTGQVAPWVYANITETFVLDPVMRERLSALNPTASAKIANRLLEAHERKFWAPDPETLEALREAGDELEDRLEGVPLKEAAA